jgi:hypothetical protein
MTIDDWRDGQLDRDDSLYRGWFRHFLSEVLGGWFRSPAGRPRRVREMRAARI